MGHLLGAELVAAQEVGVGVHMGGQVERRCCPRGLAEASVKACTVDIAGHGAVDVVVHQRQRVEAGPQRVSTHAHVVVCGYAATVGADCGQMTKEYS
jgi:hypothetical protein